MEPRQKSGTEAVEAIKTETGRRETIKERVTFGFSEWRRGQPRDPPSTTGREATRLRAEADEARNTAIRLQLLALAHSYEGLAETVEIIARQRGGD